MVRSLADWYSYPVELACELVGLPRSSYYYRSHKTDESQLVADLKTVAGQYVTYGTRRVRSQLRRPPYSYRINRKRVQRLMRQKGLLRPVKRRKAAPPTAIIPIRAIPTWLRSWKSLIPTRFGCAK